MRLKALSYAAIALTLALGIYSWKSEVQVPKEEPELDEAPLQSEHDNASTPRSPAPALPPISVNEVERAEDQDVKSEDVREDSVVTVDQETSRPSSTPPVASDPARKPLLIEDESKFQSWFDSYKGLNGMGFLTVISDLKSPTRTEDICVQGSYQSASPMLDSPDPAPALRISLDVCLGESATHRTNTAELTRTEGSTVSQPKVFPSTGGMPSGFRLIEHDGQPSIVVRSAQNVYQFFFFKSSEQAVAVWYLLDAGLNLSRQGTFALTKSSKAEGR